MPVARLYLSTPRRALISGSSGALDGAFVCGAAGLTEARAAGEIKGAGAWLRAWDLMRVCFLLFSLLFALELQAIVPG